MFIYHTDYNPEMEEDKKLDGKHTIEEAMSMCPSRFVRTCLIILNALARALMRNCPKCQKGT
jgi:hypothetical protein